MGLLKNSRHRNLLICGVASAFVCRRDSLVIIGTPCAGPDVMHVQVAGVWSRTLLEGKGDGLCSYWRAGIVMLQALLESGLHAAFIRAVSLLSVLST
jgi:hypothetical protein